jgi:eukaryotic-like serine/threonine-protein kinase
VARRLVAASGPHGYRFRHDRIREALLAEIDPATLRRMHQRIAEVLESTDSDNPRHVYLTARHYALGERDLTPHKVYETSLAAGQRALAEYAPAEAREFLLIAASAAQDAGITPAPDLHLALGVSCARTARYGDALQYLNHVLRVERDSLRRADVLAQIAWVHTSAWDTASAIESVRLGLSELGRQLPRTTFGLIVGTIARFLFGVLIGVTKIGFGTAEGIRRERYRIEADLYDAGRYSWSIRMNQTMRAIYSLRVSNVINRLGPCAEYARHQAGFGLMADIAHRPKLATRLYDRAAAVAAEIADPTLVASVEWKRGAGRHLSARDDGQLWMQTLVENERWLELNEYLIGVTMACVQMVVRGRTHEARTWYARGKARLGSAPEAEGAAFGVLAAAIGSQLGRADDAAAGLDAQRPFLARNPQSLTRLINFVVVRTIALVELGELGTEFEEVTREFAELGLKPSTLLPEQRAFHVYEAFGRLAQCHLATREKQPDYRVAATEAVARLGKAADRGIMRAFHRVARADLEVLASRADAALRELHRAELELLPLDAPLLAYETARVRARVMRLLDEPAQARTWARHALMFAAEQEWERRIQWIRNEFGISTTTPSQPYATGGHRTVQISDGV